ncbi:MAG: glycoside hydrolase family 2 protein [Anaerolineae bacterium]
MQRFSLDGAWVLHGSAAPYESVPAQVPGCVHLDLMAAGLLNDLNFGDQEKDQFFIGETDWRYQRAFDVSAELLAHEQVLLRCAGLDTLATIRINDSMVGYADNMFRSWEFDVKPFLLPGRNLIEVFFAAPMPYLRQMEAEKGALYAWSIGDHRLNAAAWLRKEPCNFGWDWGPKTVTSGIWRRIELVGFSTARLDDVRVLQDHGTPGQVLVTVEGAVEQLSDAELQVDIDLRLNGHDVASAMVSVEDGRFRAELLVEAPQLWWTNGLGAQPLYTVAVYLKAADTALDAWTRRIGLRTLTLDRRADEWGESFTFAINGVPFFAKGADWIPADPFSARIRRAQYEPLLKAAADAHMNMLRAWGGGVYEDDDFFDLCDEFGIAVWQDFVFACGTYPTTDDAFMANVTAEARDNVRRLRHHASLALWCGNNELEQGLVGPSWTATTMAWEDYGKLFDVMLPEIVRAEDPQRPYWPASPHTPLGDRFNFNDPDSGDAHLWAVWHGKMPVEIYRETFHRFVSEFGFQSFPEPHVLDAYTLPEDRNLTSYVMEYHQRSGIGNATIMHYLLAWFRMPTSYWGLLWMSQILQAEIIKYAIEHWRRHMPRTMGSLYWQLNDIWPGPSWSSLDFQGHWKALHYAARRFYRPLLISGAEDLDRYTVEVAVTSDRLEPVEGEARWTVTTTDGERLAGGTQPVTIAPNGVTPVWTLDCAPYVEQAGVRRLLVWLELRVHGEVVSSNLATLARPKHLELPGPVIRMEVRPRPDGAWNVVLQSDKPALWVWLEHEQGPIHASDNFFHLAPGEARPIVVEGTAGYLPDLLRVHSIVDVSA